MMGTTDGQAQPDYEIGYGRPPKKTQFQPGQRANPKGRPRGSPNTKTIIERTLKKKISIRRGEKTSKVPIVEAMAETFALKAAQGDRHAASVVINLAAKSGLLSPRPDDTPPSAGTAPVVVAGNARPSDALVESVDPDLLSKDDRIELSRFAECVDFLGDAMALDDVDLLRLKQIVNKGRGNNIVPKTDDGLEEAA